MPTVNQCAFKSGLVLFLSPPILRHSKNTFIEGDECSLVTGFHYFILFDTGLDSAEFEVVPCYSRSGVKRYQLPSLSRRGHSGWVNPPCFVTLEQSWFVNSSALVAASERDYSSLWNPNTVSLEWLGSYSAFKHGAGQ